MPRFEGAQIVVTGVGREGQVGEAICDAFAREGAVLALLDRNADAVRQRAAALTSAGGRANAYTCDLTDAGQVADVARRVGAASPAATGRPAGRIDALVNVAGGFAMSGPIGESDLGVLATQIAINLTTAFIASRSFVPLVRDGGHVVYFASASVLAGGPTAQMSAYVVAKSGVVGLMRSVADEGRGRGLRANAVAPTAVRTAENQRVMADGTKYVEREAVADAVMFLCSADSRSITGQVLRLAD